MPRKDTRTITENERSQRPAVLSRDPVNAHLPSGVRTTEVSYRYALKGHEKLGEKELDVRE